MVLWPLISLSAPTKRIVLYSSIYIFKYLYTCIFKRLLVLISFLFLFSANILGAIPRITKEFLFQPIINFHLSEDSFLLIRQVRRILCKFYANVMHIGVNAGGLRVKTPDFGIGGWDCEVSIKYYYIRNVQKYEIKA